MTKVSAIINFHQEGLVSIPSLKSFFHCCQVAEVFGVQVEKIAVLDGCDDLTRSVINEWISDFSQIEEVNYGDLGESRNHGVRVSKNELIATFDGDDLWGGNYLRMMIDHYTRAQNNLIVVHPELVYYFSSKDFRMAAESSYQIENAESFLFWHTSEKNIIFNKNSLTFGNVWTSNILTTKAILLNNPYRKVNKDHGFGIEDWIWNIDVLSNGICHEVAKGAVEIVRIKEGNSLSLRNSWQNLLPPIHATSGFTPKPLQNGEPLPEIIAQSRIKPPVNWVYPMNTLAIAATPRSGSTFLSSLLSCSDRLGVPQEYLNCSLRHLYHDGADLHKWRRMLDLGTTSNGIFSIKVHSIQLKDFLDTREWAEWFPNTKWVWNRRRDILNQAISLVLANQTNSCTSLENVDSMPIYSYAEIKNAVNQIELEESYLSDFFSSQEIEPLVVWYEDLVMDPHIFIAAILNFAGVEKDSEEINFNIPYQKQATELNKVWRNSFLMEDASRDVDFIRGR